MAAPFTIAPVNAGELPELLALMRGYCDFYRTAPSDEALLSISRTLLADPEREGFQLLARDHDGAACGFATVFFTFETTAASRLAVMNDLFVVPAARGTGLADELIALCARMARSAGAKSLDWVTADDNARAQRVYDRVGATGGGWRSYTLALEI